VKVTPILQFPPPTIDEPQVFVTAKLALGVMAPTFTGFTPETLIVTDCAALVVLIV